MSSEHKLCMDEAPLKEPANHPAPKNQDGCWPSLFMVVGFLFLTFNSITALYRSNGDIGVISFVVFSYVDLIALFYSLHQFEMMPAESPRREHMKMVVWLLTTMLTAAFSYKVAEIMPLPMQVLVWAMASVTVLGGFYAFFLHGEGTKA
ncbi:unnamed protein product [Urochloa humidicola]